MTNNLEEFLEEINLPITLDETISGHWPFRFSEADDRKKPDEPETVRDAIDKHLKTNYNRSFTNRLFWYSIIVIATVLCLLLFYFVIDLKYSDYNQKIGFVNQYANKTLELEIFITRMFVAFLIVLIPILAWLYFSFPRNIRHALDFLHTKNEENYIFQSQNDKNYFYFKAVDYNCDLNKLFSMHLNELLVIILVYGGFISSCFFILFNYYNAMLLNLPFNELMIFSWEIYIYLMLLLILLLTIIGIIGIVLFILRVVSFNKIKAQVKLGIEEKLLKIDYYINNQKVDIESFKLFFSYTKLNNTLNELKDLPLIPITNLKITILAFSGLSTVYSLISFILRPFLSVL